MRDAAMDSAMAEAGGWAATEWDAQGGDAAARRPPGSADLARIAGEAADRLPPAVRDRLGPLAIVVAETPDRRSLRWFEVGDPFALLGRFDAADGKRPARLTLYRRPLLDFWAERGAPLGDVVADLVWSELTRR